MTLSSTSATPSRANTKPRIMLQMKTAMTRMMKMQTLPLGLQVVEHPPRARQGRYIRARQGQWRQGRSVIRLLLPQSMTASTQRRIPPPRSRRCDASCPTRSRVVTKITLLCLLRQFDLQDPILRALRTKRRPGLTARPLPPCRSISRPSQLLQICPPLHTPRLARLTVRMESLRLPRQQM